MVEGSPVDFYKAVKSFFSTPGSLVTVTGALALATFYLGWETRKVARSTQDEAQGLRNDTDR